MANPLERLVEELRRLPGIGAKLARRLAYHLVELPADEVATLIDTIEQAKAHRILVSFVPMKCATIVPFVW